jgi:hypothetical protein
VRKLFFIVVLAGLPCANAQRMMSAPHFGPSRGAISARPFHNGAPFFGSPFFTDSLYYSDLLNAGYPIASQPPLVILQTAAPAANPAPAQAVAPTQALLIELQGDHYVRLSGAESSGAQMIDHESDSQSRAGLQISTASPPAKPASATLVFRDGHREETSEYSISNGILYATGNYYADGSWNKQIELSALNLPETVDANRSRAVQFKLPTAPNEVIVGP